MHLYSLNTFGGTVHSLGTYDKQIWTRSDGFLHNIPLSTTDSIIMWLTCPQTTTAVLDMNVFHPHKVIVFIGHLNVCSKVDYLSSQEHIHWQQPLTTLVFCRSWTSPLSATHNVRTQQSHLGNKLHLKTLLWSRTTFIVSLDHFIGHPPLKTMLWESNVLPWTSP
jgi:hypothetical protein